MRFGESDIDAYFFEFGEKMTKNDVEFLVIFDKTTNNITYLSTEMSADKIVCLVKNDDIIDLELKKKDTLKFTSVGKRGTYTHEYIINSFEMDYTGISTINLQTKVLPNNDINTEKDRNGY